VKQSRLQYCCNCSCCRCRIAKSEQRERERQWTIDERWWHRTTLIQGLLRVHIYPAAIAAVYRSSSARGAARRWQNRCVAMLWGYIAAALSVVNQSPRWASPAELGSVSSAPYSNKP